MFQTHTGFNYLTIFAISMYLFIISYI